MADGEALVSFAGMRQALKSDTLAIVTEAFKTYKPEAPAAQPSMKQDAAGGEASGAGKSTPEAQEWKATLDGHPVNVKLLGQDIKLTRMSAGGLAGAIEAGDNFRIMGFSLGPVASAVVGTGVGIVVGNLTDKLVKPTTAAGKTNWLNPIVHVGVMVGTATYGPRFIGWTASMFAAGSIAVRLAVRYTPLGNILTQAEAWLSKPLGMGQGQDQYMLQDGKQAAQQAVRQAQQIVSQPRRQSSAAYS